MTDDLIRCLRAHKADVLAELARDLDEDTREFFTARAAIAELSRAEAEQQASGRVVEYRLASIDQWLTLIGPEDGDMPTAKRWLDERYGERVEAVRPYRPGVTR
jgi:hypothetical protein